MQQESIHLRVLKLLQQSPQSHSHEDRELLSELARQFLLLNANFQFGDTCSQESSLLTKCQVFLERILQNAPSSSSSPTLNTNTVSSPVNSNITQQTVNGSVKYLLDGQPIKFKVLKNKPKNGEFQRRWNRNFENLKLFKAQHGHTHVTRTSVGFEELGNWVAEQRRKLKRGQVTQKQFEALCAIGFEWDRSYYFFRTYKQQKNSNVSQ